MLLPYYFLYSYHELKNKYKDVNTVQFIEFDVDKNENLINDKSYYDIEVKSVPTFILFENEKEIDRITGAQTREKLNEFINYKKNIEENI